MKDKHELLTILSKVLPLSKVHYPAPEGQTEEEHIYWTLRFRINTLYKNHSEIRKFLDKHTSFLPVTMCAKEKWHYYCNDETDAHYCPICGKIPDTYAARFCSLPCTRAKEVDRSHWKKTGPSIDYEALEQKWKDELKRVRPDYRIVEYGIDEKKHWSLFQHKCGYTFKAKTEQVTYIEPSTGRYKRSCICDNVNNKAYKRTLETLRIRFARNPRCKWVPVAYKTGEKTGKFRHKDCGHVCELPVAGAEKAYLCRVCEKRFFESRSVYGRKYEVTFQGKRFTLQGKEDRALLWLINNTKYTVNDIKDESRHKLRIRYRTKMLFGDERTYIPDFLVNARIIIEVKSLNSAGIIHADNTGVFKNSKLLWNTLRAKRKACVKQGYVFIPMVFNHVDELVKLPKNWMNYSYSEINEWYKSKHNRAY